MNILQYKLLPFLFVLGMTLAGEGFGLGTVSASGVNPSTLQATHRLLYNDKIELPNPLPIRARTGRAYESQFFHLVKKDETCQSLRFVSVERSGAIWKRNLFTLLFSRPGPWSVVLSDPRTTIKPDRFHPHIYNNDNSINIHCLIKKRPYKPVRFAAPSNYLDSIKQELQKKWPHNRTINLVFHGHSVPTGYRKTPVVDLLDSYPFLTLKKIKEAYPFAVVNVITTSIGGEQAEQGAKRMKDEVLTHRPDVLFIDYALNDRSIGLDRAKIAWEQMIKEAKAFGTKVILLTPTPDLKEDLLSPDAELAKYSEQIRQLAATYEVGLVDSYALFRNIARIEDLKTYMAQNNHINDKGHEVVAEAIIEYFKK